MIAEAPLAPRLLRHVSLHSASGDPGDFPSKPGRPAGDPAGCACQHGPGDAEHVLGYSLNAQNNI